MKVSIHQLAAAVPIKNTAIEFKVSDTKDKHFGDFYVDKVRIEWCSGKKRQGNGVRLKWEEVAILLGSEEAKKAALAAAKKA